MAAAGFNAEAVRRFRGHSTPFYFYDLSLAERTLSAVRAAALPHGYRIHYALKANADPRLLALIVNAGLGADCVSGNEVKRALESGFAASDIVFAGVGKADWEIDFALRSEIFSFNCESLPEIQVIGILAAAIGRRARIALRINPNVQAKTHRYITTGLDENKFGIGVYELPEVLEVLRNLPQLELTGIHFHVGSQITDLAVFRSLCLRVNEFQEWFASRKISLKHVNVGGGLGVDYHDPEAQAVPDFAAYFAVFAEFLEVRPGQEVHFELGRSIVAQCGSLISRVLYIKQGLQTNFVILDAGMTELIRPALYQAYHTIENLTPSDTTRIIRYDVVGPVCESSDCFGKALELPEMKRGDIVAIRTAGAYGESMASHYNLRALEPNLYS